MLVGQVFRPYTVRYEAGQSPNALGPNVVLDQAKAYIDGQSMLERFSGKDVEGAVARCCV